MHSPPHSTPQPGVEVFDADVEGKAHGIRLTDRPTRLTTHVANIHARELRRPAPMPVTPADRNPPPCPGEGLPRPRGRVTAGGWRGGCRPARPPGGPATWGRARRSPGRWGCRHPRDRLRSYWLGSAKRGLPSRTCRADGGPPLQRTARHGIGRFRNAGEKWASLKTAPASTPSVKCQVVGPVRRKLV